MFYKVNLFMFKNILSFSGRIRRLEYGLTYLLFLIFYFFVIFLIEFFEKFESIFYLLFILFYWLILAQGVKRCHDLGKSGFYQFIPFYGLWMLFEEGQQGKNGYGLNPKSFKNNLVIQKNDSKLFLLEGKTHSAFFFETFSAVLLNVLIVILANYFSKNSDGVNFLVLFLATIPCYFFMLYINNSGYPLPNNKKNLLRQRMLFSVLLYVIIRLYNLIFRNAELDESTVLFELIVVLIFFGITYIPYIIYLTIFKNRLKND